MLNLYKNMLRRSLEDTSRIAGLGVLIRILWL